MFWYSSYSAHLDYTRSLWGLNWAKQGICPQLTIIFIQGQTRKNEKQQMEPAVRYVNKQWINMNWKWKLDCLWACDDSLWNEHVNRHFEKNKKTNLPHVDYWQNDHLMLCISINLEVTEELQVTFQPQNWHPNIILEVNPSYAPTTGL